MLSPLSAWRIASTAAWSAAFSSPRPIRREAESAAASVTRTASSARLRSIFDGSGMAFLLRYYDRLISSEILDADHPRRFEDRIQRFDALERPPHRRLDGNMGRHHHRHRLARPPAALDHRFHRHLLVAKGGGDIGDDAGLVHHHQPYVIGALVPLYRHPGDVAEGGGGNSEGRGMAPGGDIDEIGGDGGGRREGAGAAALQHHPADEVALGDHRVVDPLDRGDRGAARHHAGVHPLLETLLRQPRDAEQLYAVAE